MTLADNLPKTGAPPATVVLPAKALPTKYPWFSDYVRGYLLAKYGDDLVYSGGLRVETTIDPALQAKADAAVTEALKGTQAPLDMALATVDPKTGFVKALVGGRDFNKSQVNLALGNCPAPKAPVPGEKPAPNDGPVCVAGGGTGRQPGSAFKPFTLAEALEDGMSLDKTYRGPGTYRYPRCNDGDGCIVHNVESGSYGTIDLRQATANSVNTVYAQLINDVGIDDTAEMAHRLGLTSINPDGMLNDKEEYGASLTLGAAEVSPLDMAASYGVFAARGMQFPATPVLKVTGHDGKVLEDNRSRAGTRVLTETIADQMNEVLKGVVTRGTGKAADLGRPNGTAGKTGTSENFSDAWFVGYTPELSTSVWMGFADAQRPLVNIKGLARIYGGTLPAKTWHDFMASAARGQAAVRLRGARASASSGTVADERTPADPDDHRPARVCAGRSLRSSAVRVCASDRHVPVPHGARAGRADHRGPGPAAAAIAGGHRYPAAAVRGRGHDARQFRAPAGGALMLFAMILIPAIVLAVAVIIVLDRMGVLPRLDGGPSLPSGGFLESVPRGALWGAGALMALWILGWVVFLIVGLSTLAG